MKLLVPVDVAHAEIWRVVDQAAQLATEVGDSEVRLLLVRSDHTDRASHDRMSALAERVLKAGTDCTYQVVDGSPGPRIVEEARGADLVVMGTHGRSGLQRAVLGSVAEYVIRRSTAPVMVVRLVE